VWVQVFLIRHAEAIDETLALRDPHRHLTARGREQAKALGERLRWHDCTVTSIWMSPLVRAVQTAELVLTGLGVSPQVVTEPALAPGDDVRPLVARLGKAATDGAGDPDNVPAVMIVGHEPSLSDLGTLLTGTADFAPLAKAEAARIDGVGGLGKGGKSRVRWRFAWDDAAPRA
jgi:phosphohistidine phosphatase